MIHEANLWTCLCDTIICRISVHPFFNHFLRPGDQTSDLLFNIFGKSLPCFAFFVDCSSHSLNPSGWLLVTWTDWLEPWAMNVWGRIVSAALQSAVLSLVMQGIRHSASPGFELCLDLIKATHVGIRTKDSVLPVSLWTMYIFTYLFIFETFACCLIFSAQAWLALHECEERRAVGPYFQI